MSIAMKEYEYNCAFCGAARKTLVSADKYEQIVHRTERIQDILRPDIFPQNYREIFITNLCSDCSEQVFGKSDGPTFDIDENENSDKLSKITEMYEADMRG